MSENEKQKGGTPAARKPKKVEGPENLLSEYAPAPKRIAPPPKAASDGAPEAVHKAASEKPADEPAPAAAPKKSAPKKNGTARTETGSNAKQSATQSGTAQGNTAKERPREEVHASTASRSAPKRDAAAKPTRAMIDLDDRPRSSRPAHRVIPYVLMAFAVILGVMLILNLICNRGNALQSKPETHLMGLAGYHICYALFGVFGPAVFILPLLLLDLSFFWKKYIDLRIALPKILVAAAMLVLTGAVIHVCCLNALPEAQREMTADDLMRYGSEMTGGGVLGGILGAFLLRYFNFIGSMIIGVLLLGAAFFYLLGTTPERLWELLCTRRELRRGMRRDYAVDEMDAELARDRARMNERIRKKTAGQMDIDDEQQVYTANEAAPAYERQPKPKKNPEDKWAPMPEPHINPGTDSRLFVPVDVNRRMKEAERAQAGAAPQAPAVPAPVAPQKPIDPAQNRDAAVDPIFPKSPDLKNGNSVPKVDRNFDLGNVFVNLDDNDHTARTHAPVPPEVPPKVSPRRNPTKPGEAAPAASTGVPAPVQKPAAAAQAPAAAPAQSASAGKPAIRLPAPPKPAGSNPIFTKSTDKGPTEFGLSSEEFEKMEAKQMTVEKKRPAPKKPETTEKAAGETKKTPPVKQQPPKKYMFPPISYLRPGEPMTAENRAEIETSMRNLAEALENFRVKIREISYSCGPTVTRYEIVPAPGVRVNKITNLEDDIALALRSPGKVRIEAPIPGTNAIGIEVPNRTRNSIYLRDMIESKTFTDAKSKLTACLGANITGQPIFFDIAKMPHLLVAGATGSGKSVCINSILISLLYRTRPDEVRLVLIDPKKVEFLPYQNIPNLMAPVVTQPKDAIGALQAAVEEMERRFEILEGVGVRDLKSYNEVTKDDPDMPYIPQIVIVIDELADLMMTAKNEAEVAICRIAQKARAAGMHLIIGTQRPSTDVVTGLIKANVPSCIACTVRSQVDSRVILDHGGAETLMGMGDMLFVPIGSMRDTRVQGAFVDEDEVKAICEFLRVNNGTAQYDEGFTAKLKALAAQCGNKKSADESAPTGDAAAGGDDPKYEEAVMIALEEGRVATSLLQRKLSIGYARAAKIIDRMQAEGIVSPPDGSKPRTVLMTKEQYFAMKAAKQAESDDE